MHWQLNSCMSTHILKYFDFFVLFLTLMLSHDICSVLWTAMTSGWIFSTFSNTSSDTLPSISLLYQLSCSLQKPPLLKHEALHFNTISSRSVTQKYMYTLILITLLYSCSRCRRCLRFTIKERKTEWTSWSDQGHIFKDTLQKEPRCLSSWMTPPNFLSSCHDNARPHTEFSLALFLSVSIYIWFTTSKSLRKHLLTVISHCFLIMFSAHCLQCVLEFV